MKVYTERYIRRSELFQLILLQHIYARPESKLLIFQGGTAIRWCHGGGRFSEDLDFVTPLELPNVERLLQAIAAPVTREAIAHFGPGSLRFVPRGNRETSKTWRVVFEPQNAREKIMVKIECERLRVGTALLTERRVLGMQTAVSYLIGVGEFRIPRPNSLLMVESSEEILSDKVRALLERPYLKGRDIYDVWHLRERLCVNIVREVVERKISCYVTPFVPRRLPGYFADADKAADEAIKEAIESDLGRFLPPAVMAVCRNEGYRPFLETLRELFRELREAGVEMPT